MQKKKIEEIRRLAQDIDPRINLFDGYTPKKTESYKEELLFWRQIVSLYGLFADSDRIQVKEKKNLITLMKDYCLIEDLDYKMAVRFWNDISEIRKWFCHNNDISLYYVKRRHETIGKYLDSAFTIYTNKPKGIEDIQQKD